jgi:hypothetical protein
MGYGPWRRSDSHIYQPHVSLHSYGCKERVTNSISSTWHSTYCTVNDSKHFLSARELARAADNDDGTGKANDGYLHRNYSEAHDPYLILGIGDRREAHSFSDKDSKPCVQVLRTCRQIYPEASRVLWATNTFSFTRPETLKAFMSDRKTAQKQLLKNLHLNMTWNMKEHKRAWEKVLTLTLVRSLKGLRAVHLRIEQRVLDENSCFHGNPMGGEDLLNTSPFEEIMKFKILPLETVTVNLLNGEPTRRHGNGDLQWPLARRVECAESLESQLLDPEGAARWQERQEHLQELARQKNEQLAQYRATQICSRFSTEEECAEFYQKRQDDKDERDGRVRKAKKIAGSCGRQHSCLICREKASSDVDEEVPNCPRPGHCEEVEGTAT